MYGNYSNLTFVTFHTYLNMYFALTLNKDIINYRYENIFEANKEWQDFWFVLPCFTRIQLCCLCSLASLTGTEESWSEGVGYWYCNGEHHEFPRQTFTIGSSLRCGSSRRVQFCASDLFMRVKFAKFQSKEVTYSTQVCDLVRLFSQNH